MQPEWEIWLDTNISPAVVHFAAQNNRSYQSINANRRTDRRI